ncbi:MAG: hypothetical protein R6U39_01350 [Candidatus Aegiribacteria sp.]
MSSRKLLLTVVSIALLLLAAECAGRPPWPGAGDVSKDRSSRVAP